MIGYSLWSVSRPLTTVLLSVLISLLIFSGAFSDLPFNQSTWSIPFKSDYKVFFKPDNQQLEDFLFLQETYTKSDNLVILVMPKSGDVFTPSNLSALSQITDLAWRLPHAVRVDSIANFQHSYARGEALVIEPLVTERKLTDSNALASIQKTALSEPWLKNNLISPDGRVALVNVTFHLPDNQMSTAVPEIAQAARTLTQKLSSQYEGFEFHLTGVLMMNASFQEIAQFDAATRIPAMLAIVFFSIGLLLRSFAGAGATLVVIALSLISTMGVWGWLGGFLTGPSTTAPVVILTLAVADCVHLLANYFQNLRKGLHKHAAITQSLVVNFKPIALTSLTTAIGFLTMNFSDAPPFIDLGNLVAIGVVFAFLFSVTLFPALLVLAPTPKISQNPIKSYRMEQVSTVIVRYKGPLFLLTLAWIVLSSLFLLSNELNDDFVKYFDQSVPFRQGADLMQQHVRGITTLELSVDSLKSQGVTDPEFMQFIDQFTVWLSTLENMTHVGSIASTLKRLNQNMHGDDPNWYRLPNDKSLIAQYLLLFEMSLPFGLDLNHQLDMDKSSTRILATFDNLTSQEILAMEALIHEYFKSLDSDYELTMSSPSLMFAHIGSTNIISMIRGTLVAFLIISLILGLVFRSFKLCLISLLPNVAPAAVAFGLWGLFNGEVGLGLSVVTGVSLGIIVDNTIHFLTKFLQLRANAQLSVEAVIHQVFGVVGRALFITTAVLTGGFLVMASSSLKVNADMGLLTAVTLVVALIIDLFFLPPLLIYGFGRQGQSLKKVSLGKSQPLALGKRTHTTTG